MNYYIDIKIQPDAEMRENILLNKVYSKFHKALSSLNSTDIGVSFPKYKVKLGDIIRIHAKQERLSELQAMNWLGGLSGYCNVGLCQPIPDDAQFRIISRKQSNMTEAKLRRLVKRGSISTEEIKKYKAKMFSQGLSNPFLELVSNSNGHHHRRFIQFNNLLDQQREGNFDQFGLSTKATIPWF